MELREIEEGLRKPGKSKSGLAKVLGRTNSAVTALLKGERRLQIDEIDKVRQYLEIGDRVPIVGAVGAGAEAHFYAEGQAPAESVPAPAGTTADTVAVEIRGDSLGAGFDGWLAFYDDRRDGITPDMLDRLCVVGLSDGRVLIKKPRKARSPGFYHLIPGAGGEIITDAKVVWAARVKQISPRQ